VGINFSTAALLANAKLTERYCFDSVLTIGHLSLNMSGGEQRRLFRHYPSLAGTAPFESTGYADDFVKLITGASSVQSLDYSSYEQCDIVHDLNQPIGVEFRDRFDAVIDGGCLEHIFNVPTALHNYASLVNIGGSIIIATVANNHMGHGFYQFSPELFFNYFSVSNGFDLQQVVLVAHPYPSAALSSRMEFYDVIDPRAVSNRVGLVSKQPVMIMAHAVKRSNWTPAIPHLIQSDYEAIIRESEQPACRTSSTTALNVGASRRAWQFARQIATYLPAAVRTFLTGRLELRRYSLRNTTMFHRRGPFHGE
jgi:hypothetical protein